MCNKRNSRLLKNNVRLEPQQNYTSLKYKLTKILEEDDGILSKRLKELMSSEPFQSQLHALLRDDNIQRRFYVPVNDSNAEKRSNRGNYCNLFEKQFNEGSKYVNGFEQKQNYKKRAQENNLKRVPNVFRNDDNSVKRYGSLKDEYIPEIISDELNHEYDKENLFSSLKSYSYSDDPKNILRYSTHNKKKYIGFIRYIIKKLMKYLKKSDALYETELINIMSYYNNQQGRNVRKKKRSLTRKIKDFLTVLSPILVFAVTLVLCYMYNSNTGIIVSSIFLIASVLYVWYKYKKCKRLCKLYGEFNVKRLLKADERRRIMLPYISPN